ncbi:hypothetical protein CTAYLR_007841 [Chrysophaeum taylorii]|uniref:Methyltransferase domain-containing protein n=1 Tax=Chrysophaeum taylorii TaxID=2483200 RepID=A0AAD7XK41_9STRA|nr:hypothetical protein CTAYLR_007841 [Chrysophaeum taylorii]
MRLDGYAGRRRLGLSDLRRFESESLFDRSARVVCGAQCVAKKELYENWACAAAIHEHFFSRAMAPRVVVDVCGGHGLLGWFLLVMTSQTRCFAVDPRIPKSAATLRDAFGREWPGLGSRHRYLEARAEDLSLGPHALVVALHACGGLTDDVLLAAVDGRAHAAVVPCCHSLRGYRLPVRVDRLDDIDRTRCAFMTDHGYDVVSHFLPAHLTPKNQVLFAARPFSNGLSHDDDDDVGLPLRSPLREALGPARLPSLAWSRWR